MSEEGKKDDGEANGGAGGDDKFEAITSQEDLDKVLGKRLERERAKFADYDDIKAKAAKFDEVEEANKTELQKAADRAAQAEKERDELRLAHARAEVALTKGLTPTQAKRLVGSTKEELEADADELLNDLGAKKPEPKKPDPKRLSSGSSGSGEANTGKERAAAALRQMRSGV